MSIYEKLVNMVHTTERHILTPWDQPLGQTCLLDYLGLSNMFITELGCIFYRDRIRATRSGFITTGYVPIFRNDSTGKYPWVKLPVGTENLVLPLNLLLGWSFTPTDDTSKRYFTINECKWILGSHTYKNCTWTDSGKEDDGENYTKFVTTMYQHLDQ